MPDPAAPALAGGKSSLQASPQNPLLGLLARALYKARDVLSPAEGSLAARKGFNIADWTLGDAPEEVENWSYGNTPFAMPQLSRIPQAKSQVVERDGKKERKNRAFMALDAAAFAPLGALDNLSGGLMKGAIRLGGKEAPVIAHTTPANSRQIESIRDKGLYAPSLGLIADTPNGYQGYQPTMVWRAGELDRQLPDSMPPGIFNRDAYVWNPDRHSSEPIVDQYKNRWTQDTHQTRLNDLTQDARLTQMLPDSGSHSASILASPNFRSLAEWENSPYGLGALESQGGGPLGLQTVRNYEWAFDELARKHGLSTQSQMQALLEQFPHLAKQQGLDTSLLRGSPLGDLYDTARGAPSVMGEMKIYAPSVPASPDEVSVYIPEASSHSAGDWQSKGYNAYNDEQLAGLAGRGTIDRPRPPLSVLAPSSGLMPPSPAEAQRMWDDLQTRGSSMVGSPGLKAPSASLGQPSASWPPGINKPLEGMAGNNASFGPLVDAAEKNWSASQATPGSPEAKAAQVYQQLLASDKVITKALAEAGFTPEQANWIDNQLGWGDSLAEALKDYYTKGPGKAVDAPAGLWSETLEWFKGDTPENLATYLGKYHDLPEDQISVLKGIWAKAVTGEQGAQDMQAYIKQLLDDLE